MAEKVLAEVAHDPPGREGSATRLSTRIDGATAILALALIVGASLRLAPAATTGFPLNDGGMFSVMVDELRANGFVLPVYTDYNHASIPYAYPPLGFYLGAAATVLGLSTLQALTWLPALLCLLTIPAFYFMTRAILPTRSQAAIATALFAVTPRALIWFLMGGGLTRSAGLLFALLTIGSFTQMCQASKDGTQRSAWIRWLALTVLCGGLTVLSHLEAAVMTAGAVTLILLVRHRTRAAFLGAGLAAGGILLVTAPWWGTIVSRFGLAPFISAAQTGIGSLSDVLGVLLHFNPAEEPFVPLIAGLGLLGIVAALVRRDWLLPAWVALAFLVDTRSRGWDAVIPLVMLAAIALTDLLIPAVSSLAAGGDRPANDFSNPLVRAFVYVLAGLALAGAALTVLQVSRASLPQPDKQAMAWVKANTPADSMFVTVTGNLSPMQDPVTEWFPALSVRTNLTTLQGSEWTGGAGFWPLLGGLTRLQACFLGNRGCLSAMAQKLDLKYDYLYIEKYNADYPCPGKACTNSQALIDSLKQTERVAYESDQVVVFQVR